MSEFSFEITRSNTGIGKVADRLVRVLGSERMFQFEVIGIPGLRHPNLICGYRLDNPTLVSGAQWNPTEGNPDFIVECKTTAPEWEPSDSFSVRGQDKENRTSAELERQLLESLKERPMLTGLGRMVAVFSSDASARMW